MTLEQLANYGVTFDEFVQQESLVGRFVIPSSLQANNKIFYQDDLTTQKEAFRLIGTSSFDACDINCYFVPTKLLSTGYDAWTKKVGKQNAFLFKKAVYCEIKARMLANDFPELANLTTSNINSINVNSNSQTPIFTTDLLNKQSMSFLDQSTFDQIAKFIDEPYVKSNDEIFAFIDWMNVYIENHENQLVLIKNKTTSYIPSLPFSHDLKIEMANISSGLNNYLASTYYDLATQEFTEIKTMFPLASQTTHGLMSALDKQKIDNFKDKFIGYFDTVNDLNTAYPTPPDATDYAGYYAYVRKESKYEMWVWDILDAHWENTAISGGIVNSVTGTQVDNTDPVNPIINMPSLVGLQNQLYEITIDEPGYWRYVPVYPYPPINAIKYGSSYHLGVTQSYYNVTTTTNEYSYIFNTPSLIEIDFDAYRITDLDITHCINLKTIKINTYGPSNIDLNFIPLEEINIKTSPYSTAKKTVFSNINLSNIKRLVQYGLMWNGFDNNLFCLPTWDYLNIPNLEEFIFEPSNESTSSIGGDLIINLNNSQNLKKFWWHSYGGPSSFNLNLNDCTQISTFRLRIKFNSDGENSIILPTNLSHLTYFNVSTTGFRITDNFNNHSNTLDLTAMPNAETISITGIVQLKILKLPSSFPISETYRYWATNCGITDLYAKWMDGKIFSVGHQYDDFGEKISVINIHLPIGSTCTYQGVSENIANFIYDNN
ncbi:MAG: hypothetical protein LBD63_03335 [Mycoplasmataceae bacterium]|nr:hypothetical protein [Mycoplasmataceae bacterium]